MFLRKVATIGVLAAAGLIVLGIGLCGFGLAKRNRGAAAEKTESLTPTPVI